MVLGVQLRATYLELEGDALEVVQALNHQEHSWGRNGPVLNDIKLLLQNFNEKSLMLNGGQMGRPIV